MKTAVVTGANKGIGYCIAKGLLSRGFFVFLGCRNAALGAEALKSLGAPDRVRVVHVDLEVPATAVAAATDVKTHLIAIRPDAPFLDVLVNNAGFAFKTDATEPFARQARLTNDVNYFGTAAVCEAFLPVLAPSGARVVNVSSQAGLLRSVKNAELRHALTSPTLTKDDLNRAVEAFIAAAKEGRHTALGWPNSAYGTSKIAVNALTRIYANDPRWAHVTTNCMCPGWCRTDMAGQNAHRSAEQGADTAVWLATDPTTGTHRGEFFYDRQRISFDDGSRL